MRPFRTLRALTTVSLPALALSASPGRAVNGAWSDAFPTSSLVRGSYTGEAYCATTWDPDGPSGSDEVFVIGGRFHEAGGITATNVASWDGTRFSPLGSGLGSTATSATDGVKAVAVYDEDGPGGAPARLFVGGNFVTAGGLPIEGIARWDGSSWSVVGGGLQGDQGEAVDVRALARWDPDGSGPAGEVLVAGGIFFGAEGQPVFGLASWDGATWTPLATEIVLIGGFGVVNALAVYDGDLVVGGNFHRIEGVEVGRVAAWDGASWTTLGGGVAGGAADVMALASFTDGGGERLIAGGSFDAAGGVATPFVAAWDGATWSAMGDGFDAPVYVFGEFAAPGATAADLYAGGEFVASGADTVLYFARWDGAAWEEVGSATEYVDTTVRAFAPFDPDGDGPKDERLWVGGGVSLPGSCTWTWTGEEWIPLGNGLSASPAESFPFDPDGDGPEPTYLWLTGLFTHAGELRVDGHARWDGHEWSAAPSLQELFGADGDVRMLGWFAPDGGAPELYVTGAFTRIDGVTARGIARYDGTAWHALGTGVSRTMADAFVWAGSLVVHAYGSFEAGGEAAENLAMWDGTAWHALGDPPYGPAAAADHDGPGGAPARLYAARRYYDIWTVDYLQEWSGTDWVTAAPGYGYVVRDLESFDADASGPEGETLFLGGGLPAIGGKAVRKYDGQFVSDAWPDTGTSTTAWFGAVDLDGGGPEPKRLFAFVPWEVFEYDHGTTWISHGSVAGSVSRFVEWDVDGSGPADPVLVATGYFDSVGGVSSGNIAIFGDGDAATGVPAGAAAGRALTVGPPVPHPFADRVTLDLSLPHPARVEARVFDVRGRLVRRLLDEPLPAGTSRVTWDGRNDENRRVASGVYFVRVGADGNTETRRTVLLR